MILSENIAPGSLYKTRGGNKVVYMGHCPINGYRFDGPDGNYFTGFDGIYRRDLQPSLCDVVSEWVDDSPLDKIAKALLKQARDALVGAEKFIGDHGPSTFESPVFKSYEKIRQSITRIDKFLEGK